MSTDIESLLFKQVKKPKHHYMTKIINVYDNRYRINVYIEIEEDNLTKRKISNSYFCHYTKNNLVIIDGLPNQVDNGLRSDILVS
jgi:hypothetical protein